MAKIICVATPLYAPEIGGPATHVAFLEQELSSRGFELRVVKFSQVRSLPRAVRHIAYYRLLKKAALGADCIYALDPVSVGLPARFAAKKLGIPLVLRVGGDYAWEQGVQRFGVTETLDEFVRTKQPSAFVRLMQRVQAQVAQASQDVIAPSKYLAGIIEAWGVPASHIKVVYSQPELPAHFESRAEARTALQLSPESHIVFSAGRLVPWKGFEGLVDAVASLEGVQLYIAGDGPNRASLEEHITKRQMKARVTLLGRISHEEILRWLCAADVFALNTEYEGLSHQLLEAFAARVPVITTPVGGNVELIENGREGVLVSPKSTEALSGAIDKILSDRTYASELAVRAYASLSRFSPKIAADALADLFSKI